MKSRMIMRVATRAMEIDRLECEVRVAYGPEADEKITRARELAISTEHSYTYYLRKLLDVGFSVDRGV